MQKRIECPICESQFDVAQGSLPESYTCLECNRQFDTSDAIVVQVRSPRREKLILPEEVLSQNVDKGTPEPITAPASKATLQKTHESKKESTTIQARKRTFAKPPNKLLPVTAMGIMAAMAIGLLVYLPITINRGNSAEEPTVSVAKTTTVENENSASVNASNTLISPTAKEANSPDSGANTAEESLPEKDSPALSATKKILAGFGEQELPEPQLASEPEKKPVPKPETRKAKLAPMQELEHFVPSDLEDCRRDHHSRIVRLKVANAMGERLALGTIIDSRGWVVTSYRAIAGATEIRVTQSASSFDQFKSGKLLSDLVRGVLHVDIQHDLAVLAINRRFVVNFSDIAVASEDSIEANSHLAQFGIIDQDTPLVLRETQVTERPLASDLEAPIREHFKQLGLDSESIRWVKHTNLEGVVSGAPIVTIDGELVAICTEQPNSNASYAVSASPLNGLIEEIEKDPKTDGGKIPRDLSLLSQKLDEVGKENLGPDVAVEINNPYRQDVVNFNQIGDKCSQFKFVPTDSEQYKLVQSFASQLVALNATIYKLSSNPDAGEANASKKHKDELSTLLKRWTDEMKTSWTGDDVDLDQIKSFNKLAANAIVEAQLVEGEDTYFVAYVDVRLGPIDSPKLADGNDTITLNISETKEILNVRYRDRFPTMLPETTWVSIFTVNTDGKVVFNIPGTRRKQKATPAEIRWLPRKPLK